MKITNEELLTISIFKNAAQDYVEAILINNTYRKKALEKFITSGAYDISAETGQYIVDKLQEEINICRNVINSFLASDNEKMYVNQRKIVPWVLRTIVSVKYSCELKLTYEKKIRKIFVIWSKSKSHLKWRDKPFKMEYITNSERGVVNA